MPVYAEMSSVNPAILLPAALKGRLPALVDGFIASLIRRDGQFRRPT